MRVLALETSDRIGSLATLEIQQEQLRTLGSAMLPSDQRSARTLSPSIKSLLQETGWKPQQLDLICVTTGPGSFTGLRLGVTTAKTLAYATGAEVVGVHTLAAIAAGVTVDYQQLWTVIDAQRQELFVALFTSGWQDQELPGTSIVKVEDWLPQLQPGDLVCGPPLRKLAEQLPIGVLIADENTWTPRAEIVGQLGTQGLQRGQAVDAMQLIPHYYRKSAAEEKADAQQ